MKKKEAVLDFTSLLDVTLIIIFFFVIFSHFDSEENKGRVDAKILELEDAILEAQLREAEADELAAQLAWEIQMVRDSDERQAASLEEMIEFERNGNLKIILDIENGKWSVRMIAHEKIVDVIASEQLSKERFAAVLQSIGYKKDDTIFCDFVFNGSLAGTASAYRKITAEITQIRNEYKYLFYSETDLSIGGN